MSARERRVSEREDGDSDFGSVPGDDDSGGTAGGSNDRDNDQEASRRVGGSGDPDDEPAGSGGTAGGSNDRDNDQEASRRVGGSGDPDDEPAGDDDPATEGGGGRGNRPGDTTPGSDEDQDPYDADDGYDGGGGGGGFLDDVSGAVDDVTAGVSDVVSSGGGASTEVSPSVPSSSISRNRADPFGGDGFSDALDDLAQDYTETIAEPAGDVVGDATPSTAIEQRVTGTDVTERAVESTATGVAQLGNIPAGILGAREAVTRLDEDLGRGTQSATTVGPLSSTAIIPDEDTRDVAADFGEDAASVGAAAAARPVETAGSLFGASVGGAVASRSAFGAARRARGSGSDSVDVGEVEAVSTGRENVGTGGLDDILDADTIDEARGVSGPSTVQRARGSVSRQLDDIGDRIADGLDDAVDPFIPGDETGRVGSGLVPRSREQDVPDAPTDFDRTRPPGAGGTFEDVRDDALTQIQDDLRGRGRRPDAGDFDGAREPFGRDRGPLYNPETGEVELQRSTASPGRAPQTATDDVARTFDDVGVGAAAGTGTTVGAIDETNDPTGIDQRTTPDFGLDASASLPGGNLGGGAGPGVRVDPVNDPTGISDTGGGQSGDEDTGGTVDPVNDPTRISDSDSEPTITSPTARVDSDVGPVGDVDIGATSPPATDTDTRVDTATDAPQRPRQDTDVTAISVGDIGTSEFDGVTSPTGGTGTAGGGGGRVSRTGFGSINLPRITDDPQIRRFDDRDGTFGGEEIDPIDTAVDIEDVQFSAQGLTTVDQQLQDNFGGLDEP